MYLCFRTTFLLASISPDIRESKFALTRSKWTLSGMVRHFSVLQLALPTAHISLVPLNHLPSPANWVSTLPQTLSLWHRRCCHHNLADITRMHKEGLVTGMTFGSSTKLDIVCEPCLAGKMHSNPFPSSSSRATQPLELVHSDLHGPLPVVTREGYHYWMTFIDNATSHHAAMQLKRKSDAFEAFKTYKAFVENHFQMKMKEFQDDKGREYMSAAFIKFTDACGIHRRHCWNYHLVILMTTHVAGTCIQLPPFPNPPHPFPICTVLLMISHACLVSDSADSCI